MTGSEAGRPQVRVMIKRSKINEYGEMLAYTLTPFPQTHLETPEVGEVGPLPRTTGEAIRSEIIVIINPFKVFFF